MASSPVVTLPRGFTVRAASWDDLAGVVELFREADLEDWGEVDVTEVAIRDEWEDPDFDLARDTWLVLEEQADSSSGIPAAYASAIALDNHRHLQSWGVVHPSHRGKGLGSHLIDLIEAHAEGHLRLADSDQHVVLRIGVVGTSAPSHRLIEGRGFMPVRHFWRLQRSLTDDLAGPGDIAGIRLRPFRYGEDDRAFHAAVEESFADHWGFVQRGFDEWAAHRFHESAFNPDLWFVAEEGAEVVGCLMGVDENGKAWVGMLGVRPAWRRRGVGEALLRHAFVEFRRRGYDEVGLTVDAANQTGATALYERVGMHAIRRYDVYEKTLR